MSGNMNKELSILKNKNYLFTIVAAERLKENKEVFGRSWRKGWLTRKQTSCMYDCTQVTHFNNLQLELLMVKELKHFKEFLNIF